MAPSTPILPTIPTDLTALPGMGPHDGERPRWWLLNNEFVKSLGSPETRGVGGEAELGDSDRKTLLDVLATIRAARAALAGSDPSAVRNSLFSLLRAIGYVTGFLTAKGHVLNASPLAAWGQTPNDAAGRDALLDAIEQQLSSLTGLTRGPTAGAAVASAVLPLAGVFFVAGLAIKAAAATLPDNVPD
jgi:hypothetical protein